MTNNNRGMASELFISNAKKQPMEYWIPPKTKETYLKELQSCTNPRSKPKILDALIHIYRSSTINNGGRYSTTNCDELIGIFSNHMDDPSLGEVTAYLLVREGSYCETVRGFDAAIKFYGKSLSYKIKDFELRYFRLNNLAFCLNYLGRFTEAEPILREAIAIDPSRYNAHKNLGVSLEHQEQFEEAARCYLRSWQLCPTDGRAGLHLKRLIERHPELINMTELSDFLGSQRSDAEDL